MRFLGIGHSCDLGDMYMRLRAQGHEVRVYSRDLAEHGVLVGLLDYVESWEKQLPWIRDAGPDGVILFETAEHGAIQEQLRREGFQVIGGSELGDRLENDRAFGQRALASVGLSTLPTYAFDDFERAIAFVEAHPRRYVFKLDGSETADGQVEAGWTHEVAHVGKDQFDRKPVAFGARTRLREIMLTQVYAAQLQTSACQWQQVPAGVTRNVEDGCSDRWLY